MGEASKTLDGASGTAPTSSFEERFGGREAVSPDRRPSPVHRQCRAIADDFRRRGREAEARGEARAASLLFALAGVKQQIADAQLRGANDEAEQAALTYLALRAEYEALGASAGRVEAFGARVVPDREDDAPEANQVRSHHHAAEAAMYRDKARATRLLSHFLAPTRAREAREAETLYGRAASLHSELSEAFEARTEKRVRLAEARLTALQKPLDQIEDRLGPVLLVAGEARRCREATDPKPSRWQRATPVDLPRLAEAAE